MRHPLHPMFVHFPIALWTVSLAWDATALVLGDEFWWRISFWCLVAGLVMAVPAVVTGFIEYTRIERGHPAARIAEWHMSAMSAAAVMFLLSLLMREGTAEPSAAVAAVACSAAGMVGLAGGGWLASRLVYGYGIGAGKSASEDDIDSRSEPDITSAT